jgi:O-antigen ligase
VVLVFIALLSSKAGYITALFVLSVVLIQSIRAGLSLTKSLGAFALAIVIFSITVINLQSISQRLENAVMDLRIAKQRLSENSDTVSQATSTQMRLVTWQASMQVLMENPFGTGTGDTQQALNTIYLQKSELHPAEKNLNAHNQFLQYGAELGWPALVAIFLCLYALWKSDMAEKTVQLFVLICGLNFLFESMLEVQAGIVFFCFWVLVYSKTQR